MQWWKSAHVAEPAVRSDYMVMCLDALIVENAARRAGGEPCRIRGHWREPGRRKRSTGIVDERDGRSQVVAADSD
jgi:hypothetical protein